MLNMRKHKIFFKRIYPVRVQKKERKEERKLFLKQSKNLHYTHFFFQSKISRPFQRKSSQIFKINSKEHFFHNLIFIRAEL